MPAFGRRPGAPVVDAPVKKNAGPDARADRRVKHILVATARAPQSFRKPGGVCIVVDFDGAAITARDFRRQRKISPARHVGRIQHHPGAGIERPGSTDPDTLDRAARLGRHLQQGIDRGRHRGEPFRSATCRIHRRARVMKDFTLPIDETSGHFCAADIDANHPSLRVVSIQHSGRPLVATRASCSAAPATRTGGDPPRA